MKFAVRKVHFLQNEGPKFELVGSFTVSLPCVHSGLYSRFQNWSIAGSVRNKIQIVPGELDMNLPAAFFRQSLSPWTMWNAKYCSPHLVSTRIGREKTLVWTLTVLISKKSPLNVTWHLHYPHKGESKIQAVLTGDFDFLLINTEAKRKCNNPSLRTERNFKGFVCAISYVLRWSEKSPASASKGKRRRFRKY